MSQDISLEEIIKKIINKTGLSREEILKAIDENINKVNGLLTQVGAAFILAEKLKVNIDMESFETLPDEDPSIVPIGNLQEGMRNINVVGRIYRMNPVKTFQRVDGRKGRVAAIFIQDESGKIKVTLWDQKAMLVQNSLSMNQIIAIYNGYVKRGLNNQLELNVGNKGGIKPKPPGIDESQYPEVTIKTCKIGDIDKTTEICSVKVKVVDKLSIKEFTRKNGTIGKIGKCVIADETGAMNLVFWTNDISKFEKLQVGHTLEIENGSVRENNYSNQIEMQIGPSTKIRKTNDDIEIKQTPTTNVGKSVSGEIIDDFSTIPERGFNLTLKGKVIGKSDVTNWSKNGRDGAVARLTLQDEGLHSLTVVFWTEHIDSFNKLSIGDLVEITNAYTKVNRNNVEANVSKNSTVKTHGKQKVSPTVMKIDQVKENQALLTVEGRIVQVDEPKDITTRTGSNIKLVNFTIADESGAINCVAWRDQVDEITALKPGDLIGLKNVKSQFSSFLNALEISLTRDSKVYIPNDTSIPSLEKLPEAPTRKSGFSSGKRLQLNDIETNQRGEILGYVTNVSRKVNFYLACPQCRKKVTEVEGGYMCNTHGEVTPNNRLIFKFTVDDGNGNLAVTMIGEIVDEFLGLSLEEKEQLVDPIEQEHIIEEIKKRIILKPFLFQGNVKFNDFRDELEMIANSVSEADMHRETEKMITRAT